MRWDVVAHLAVGFGLVLGLAVLGTDNPRVTAPLCLGVAVAREASQRPRNGGWEQGRDAGYTALGCAVAGGFWQRHRRQDARVDSLLVDARLRLAGLRFLDEMRKLDSARADSIRKAKMNLQRIGSR